MTFVISTTESIDNLALAIYDDKEETLREVRAEDLVFPIFATNRLIKRFFLIGELLYKNSITVTTTSSDPLQYTTKVVIGRNNLRYSDFIEYSSSDTTTYDTSTNKYLNALPVDVYIESLGYSEMDVSLDIDISVGAV